MKIAMFVETFLPQINGMVTRICSTLDCLSNSNNTVLLFAPKSNMQTYKNIKIIGVNYIWLKKVHEDMKLTIPTPRIFKELNQFKPDIIHVLNPSLVGRCLVFYCRSKKIPYVTSYHFNVTQYLDVYKKMLHPIKYAFFWSAIYPIAYFIGIHSINMSDICLVPIMKMTESLKKMGCKNKNIQVWPTGVDKTIFSFNNYNKKMRKRLSGEENSKLVFLYVGRLDVAKGIYNIKPILDAFPEASLAIVGKGESRQMFEEYFKGTKTKFLGVLKGKELSEAYASADVFIIPSKIETFGFVVLEAMASGLLVVGANCAALPFVIDDNENGFLYHPDNPKEAIKKIKFFLNSEKLKNKILSNAQSKTKNMSWEKATEKLVQIYQQTIKNNDKEYLS